MTPQDLIDVQELINDPDCLVVSNHSGGKDSQAMYIMLKGMVPAERLVVIHSHLPVVEWDGTQEFIEETIEHEFHVVQAGKTFLEMVDRRGQFPSPSNRQCTSDLKRDPIAKKVRHLCNERGYKKVLNCMGLRAEESPARKKKNPFRLNKRQTNSKRTWYEWLPIHELTTAEVFQAIKDAGQVPFWTYSEGLTRKSCSFCIMSSKDDLCIAARLRPDLLEKYDQLERKHGRTMLMPGKDGPKTLKQTINEHLKTTKL